MRNRSESLLRGKARALRTEAIDLYDSGMPIRAGGYIVAEKFLLLLDLGLPKKRSRRLSSVKKI